MTSRAGQALFRALEFLDYGGYDAPRFMEGYDFTTWGEAVAAIEQEVRDDIRDAVMRLTKHPDCICGGEENRSPTVSRREVLAAISSSSATETQDGERPGLRAAVLQAVAILDHTSDRHATDARLILDAALAQGAGE